MAAPPDIPPGLEQALSANTTTVYELSQQVYALTLQIQVMSGIMLALFWAIIALLGGLAGVLFVISYRHHF